MTTIARPPVLSGLDISRVYTADEVFAFPQDWHFELIAGRLRRRSMPAGGRHGARTNRLATPISSFVYQNELGKATLPKRDFSLLVTQTL